MNSSGISWISHEQGMDTSFFMDQYDFMDYLDEDFDAVFGQNFNNNSITPSTFINNPNSNYSFTTLEIEQAKTQIPDNLAKFSSMSNVINPDQAPTIVSLGNPNNPSQNLQQGTPMPSANNPKEDVVVGPEVLKAPAKAESKKKRSGARRPSQSYDHIMAERKRREQLSQLFVALSAIVPGLKKMDKSSVLEDAIKYMKYLKDSVQKLEEQAKKQAMESVVVKKSQIVVEDEGFSDEHGGATEQPLPVIEATICDKHILLRVHCENKKGILAKLLYKVESLNMIIVNATTFGIVSLDITITAELEKEFNLTIKEVVMAIRAALQSDA